MRWRLSFTKYDVKKINLFHIKLCLLPKKSIYTKTTVACRNQTKLIIFIRSWANFLTLSVAAKKCTSSFRYFISNLFFKCNLSVINLAIDISFAVFRHDLKNFWTILLRNCVESLIRSHGLPVDVLFEKVAPYVCGKTGLDGFHHLSFLLRLKEPLPIVIVDGKDSLWTKRPDVTTLIVCKKNRLWWSTSYFFFHSKKVAKTQGGQWPFLLLLMQGPPHLPLLLLVNGPWKVRAFKGLSYFLVMELFFVSKILLEKFLSYVPYFVSPLLHL